MADIFDIIDSKLPDVRASVRRNLKRRLREGAVIASVRNGKLQLENSPIAEKEIPAFSAHKAGLAVKRKPTISVSEMKMFATSKMV